MIFETSVLELIKARTSTRTYEDQAFNSDTLEKIELYLTEINEVARLQEKIKARFIIAYYKGSEIEEPKKLGTYGFISGANAYIVGIVDKNEIDALKFGYLFENIILAATHLGLQTCWLGGTFKKSDFEQQVELSENEFIAIISPIGIKKEKPRYFESVMRRVIGADKRKSWSELFFDGSIKTPLTEATAGEYATPLEMVRLGPSASNKQPWRIIKDADAFNFYMCRTKGYGGTRFDMQLNDIGIAKCHFELACNELHLSGQWQTIASPQTPVDWTYICTWNSKK